MEILRGLFRLDPRAAETASWEHWRDTIRLAMRCRRSRGSEWPPGTADDIATLIEPLRVPEGIRVAVHELQRRDVGGRNTFAHGSGI